jgi:magnesium transporter
MSFGVAFDFNARTESAIEPAEAESRMGRGCFCWLDLDLDDATDAAGLLAAIGFEAELAARVLSGDPEARYDLGAGLIHFGLTEAVYGDGGLRTAHVHVVLTERALVTAHRGPVGFLRRMAGVYREDFLRFSQSPGFLLYEIGDGLLEGYRRGRRCFAGEVEQLHENLLTAADEEVFARVSALTRDLLGFRKIVLASAETLRELAVRKSAVVPATTQPYLESVADAIERIGDDLTVQRDTLNDAVNLYMGAVSHHTNRVVKRLTIVGTIFMPLTFLCGVYGMNMVIPEAEWKGMYLVFWALCLVLVSALLWMMRKWKWL